MQDTYYATRYSPDPARSVVWKEIVRYLMPFIPEGGAVLDLGSGYCDFINNIKVGRRIAADCSQELKNHVGTGVEMLQTQAWDLTVIADASLDVVHASNLLEHLTDEELEKTIAEARRVLKPGGRLILLQPNYRLAQKTYFDDPTHKKIFTDRSLQSFLESHGFRIVLARPRFLPFSLRSKPKLIPASALLARLYINSPIKPFAGQMLFIAEKI
jgi:ubiquinone/menaquinone biosynthesis C-methylase UbiE